MSANGDPTTSGFEDLNGNAIVVAAEGRVRTDFFGLTGTSAFGHDVFPTKSSLRSIRDWTGTRSRTARSGLRKVPGTFSTTSTSICTSPKRALTEVSVSSDGSGVSDGNPNFMKFFGSFGVGGKGMFESRPNDKFGLGYYFINVR